MTSEKNSSPTRSAKYNHAGYKTPRQGYMALLPHSILPYAELIRLDKPGFVYFFYPHLFGLLQAASSRHTPGAEVGQAMLVLLCGTIFLTFVNYAWNDTVDADFDCQVERTCHRPVARGAISRVNAFAFTATLALLTGSVLALLTQACAITSVPLIVGAFVYPLSKRFTSYPQLIFGPVIASGVFMGAAALDVDPLAKLFSRLLSNQASIQSLMDLRNDPMWTLFLANTAWAVCYELVYSFQDVEYDAAAGVRTMTLRIRKNPKPLLYSLAAAQILLLAVNGAQRQAGAAFYILAVFGTAVSMVVKLHFVCLNQPESYIWWFSRGGIITDAIMTSGFVADYTQS